MAPTLIEREMSSSLDEFIRGVVAAYPAAALVTVAGGLHGRIDDDGAGCDIEVAIGPGRRVAGLELPTLAVRLSLDGDPVARPRLLRRLDLMMQRGGG